MYSSAFAFSAILPAGLIVSLLYVLDVRQGKKQSCKAIHDSGLSTSDTQSLHLWNDNRKATLRCYC